MKIRTLVLLCLCLAILRAEAGVSTNRASALFFSLSLRFFPAPGPLGLGSLTLGTTPTNGEVRPTFDYRVPTHESGFELMDPSLYGAVLGQIAFDIPSTDLNGNGFPDLFEADEAVDGERTQGEFRIPWLGDVGTVEARWNRAWRSKTGTCELTLVSSGYGALGTYRHSFEILSYNGVYSYVPGETEVEGEVFVNETVYPTAILYTSMHLEKDGNQPPAEFGVLPTTWKNQEEQTLLAAATSLQWDQNLKINYYGLVTFEDGFLETDEDDYRDWVLSIDDRNDTDGDGVPDLSDDPAFAEPRAATLAVEWSGETLLLHIDGDLGVRYQIQVKRGALSAEWENLQAIVLQAPVPPIVLLLPHDGPAFWRVITE